MGGRYEVYVLHKTVENYLKKQHLSYQHEYRLLAGVVDFIVFHNEGHELIEVKAEFCTFAQCVNQILGYRAQYDIVNGVSSLATLAVPRCEVNARHIEVCATLGIRLWQLRPGMSYATWDDKYTERVRDRSVRMINGHGEGNMNQKPKMDMFVLSMSAEQFARALGLPPETTIHRIETKITPTGYDVELVIWRDPWTGDIAEWEDWQRQFIAASKRDDINGEG